MFSVRSLDRWSKQAGDQRRFMLDGFLRKSFVCMDLKCFLFFDFAGHTAISQVRCMLRRQAAPSICIVLGHAEVLTRNFGIIA
jgi:hypothetical protein